MQIKIKFVDAKSGAALWPDLEKLFGEKGACGGCWCMFWRQDRGEKWDTVKGAKNRSRFKKLITGGKTYGAIAYDGKTPIGWCAFDKREHFAKLNRAPSLACEDADQVWSIPCFYITAKYRNQGVGTALLEAVVKALKKKNATIIEGYPVRAGKSNPLPAAFAWTGTVSLFQKRGFEPADKKSKGKVRMRLHPKKH